MYLALIRAAIAAAAMKAMHPVWVRSAKTIGSSRLASIRQHAWLRSAKISQMIRTRSKAAVSFRMSRQRRSRAGPPLSTKARGDTPRCRVGAILCERRTTPRSPAACFIAMRWPRGCRQCRRSAKPAIKAPIRRLLCFRKRVKAPGRVLSPGIVLYVGAMLCLTVRLCCEAAIPQKNRKKRSLGTHLGLLGR